MYTILVHNPPSKMPFINGKKLKQMQQKVNDKWDVTDVRKNSSGMK